MIEDDVESRIIVRAFFESSPVNSWPGGLYEVDTVRLGDSKLKDLLEACALLANGFISQFLPSEEAFVDHVNFISKSLSDNVYFSAVMADRALSAGSLTLIAEALNMFCCRCIERAVDLFNANADDWQCLSDAQKGFVEGFVADFAIKKNGAKIRDPFVLQFPPMPKSGDIAVQGKFLPPVTSERKVDSYEGVAISDGGHVTRKTVFLELCTGHDHERCRAMPFSVESEALVRLVCEAAGSPSKRLRVEADQLENGVGQRQWTLRCAEPLPDDSPADFELE